MASIHESSATGTIRDHPVWGELAQLAAAAFRYEMARSLFVDVRPAWEAAEPPATAPSGYDGITTLALAAQLTARAILQDSLFADARPPLP